MKNPNILVVIPARGGSKGIKNKNIIELDGQPLICHTIKAAIKSTMLTDFIVSRIVIELLKHTVTIEIFIYYFFNFI